MKYLYFVSFELRSTNLKITEMCQLVLDKPVRSFGDVLNMAKLIKENFVKSLGECCITILNYQRLEEETIYEEQPQEEVAAETTEQ